jgi:hypothetical protein
MCVWRGEAVVPFIVFLTFLGVNIEAERAMLSHVLVFYIQLNHGTWFAYILLTHEIHKTCYVDS